MKNVWDEFGRWDDFANLNDVSAIKAAISGSGVWIPNYVSSQTQYAFEFAIEELRQVDARTTPTVVDFGCGLGRNGSMLRSHFPRAIGFDLPDMLSRLKGESAGLTERTYDELYSDASVLASSERFCLLYDSVAFQHIVDHEFISQLLSTMMRNPYFKTFVTIYFNGGGRAMHHAVLESNGWEIWYTELDVLSFRGAPHAVSVYRR